MTDFGLAVRANFLSIQLRIEFINYPQGLQYLLSIEPSFQSQNGIMLGGERNISAWLLVIYTRHKKRILLENGISVLILFILLISIQSSYKYRLGAPPRIDIPLES